MYMTTYTYTIFYVVGYCTYVRHLYACIYSCRIALLRIDYKALFVICMHYKNNGLVTRMAHAMVPFEGLVLTKDLIKILIRDLNFIVWQTT